MKYISFPNEQAIQVYIETIFFDGIELGITRKELHTFLQENIAALAAEFWLTSKKEYLVTNYSSNQRNGYVDVVWTIGSSPLVAIEIDSSLREKSVKKLLASSANLLFWVYYGNRPFEPLINMLDLEGKVKVLHFPSKLWKYRVKPQDPEPIEKE